MKRSFFAAVVLLAIVSFCSTGPEKNPVSSANQPQSSSDLAVSTDIGNGKSACPPGWVYDLSVDQCFNIHGGTDGDGDVLCPQSLHAVLFDTIVSCCPGRWETPDDCENVSHCTPPDLPTLVVAPDGTQFSIQCCKNHDPQVCSDPGKTPRPRKG